MTDQPLVKPEAQPPVPKPVVKPGKPEGKGKGDKKWMLWGLIGFTGILLITAVILFLQLRKPAEEALPPRPVASPRAEIPEVKQAEPEGVCEMSFTITASPSPTPTPTPSASPSPPPTACFDTCEIDSDCDGDLRCMNDPGEYRCVNDACPEDSDCDCDAEELVCFDRCELDSECPGDLRCMTYPGTSDSRCLNADCREESDCGCPGATPPPRVTPSPIVRAPEPELPVAGVSAPAVLGVSAGLLLVLFGLLF